MVHFEASVKPSLYNFGHSVECPYVSYYIVGKRDSTSAKQNLLFIEGYGMYTWLFWRALQTPPIYNPLYRQMQIEQQSSWLDRFWNALIGLLLLLLFTQPPLFVIALLFIPIVYPILSSTCYGVLFSLRTATVVFARRQQGSYDLIRIAPGGAWTSFWAVCAGSVHRNGDLDRLQRYLKKLITMLFAIGLILLFGSVVVPTEDLKIEFVTMLIIVITMITLMYLELTQSLMLSTFMGMVFAIHARTTVDSRIGALVGFLAMQLTTYLTSAVLVLNLIYPNIEAMTISPIVAMFIGCAMLMAYIFLLRETFAFMLWRLIARQLNMPREEMRQVMLYNNWIGS